MVFCMKNAQLSNPIVQLWAIVQAIKSNIITLYFFDASSSFSKASG